MTDDLIERFSDYVEVALDPSGAAQALTAAQARIAELEAERDSLPWRIKDIKRGLILFRTSSNAHGYTNYSALSGKIDALPDSAKEELAAIMTNMALGYSRDDVWANGVIQQWVDEAHERGRLQGLDEAVEVAKATEERCLRQRGDGLPLNAIDRENRLDWYNRSRGAKMTAESIIALKTKGGE